MKKTAIYVLIDPQSGDVRYVGKTVQPPMNRLGAHLRRSKALKTHRDCWIAGLLTDGFKPVIRVIEYHEGSGWEDRERFWISSYLRAGATLTNQTAGGEGVDPEAARASWTEARRKAQSDRTAAMNKARAGVPWSTDRKARQAEIQKLSWERKEVRAARVAGTRQAVADPIYRANMAKAVAAAWTPERRAAQSLLAKLINSRPEKRAAQSVLMRRMNASRNAVGVRDVD